MLSLTEQESFYNLGPSLRFFLLLTMTWKSSCSASTTLLIVHLTRNLCTVESRRMITSQQQPHYISIWQLNMFKLLPYNNQFIISSQYSFTIYLTSPQQSSPYNIFDLPMAVTFLQQPLLCCSMGGCRRDP